MTETEETLNIHLIPSLIELDENGNHAAAAWPLFSFLQIDNNENQAELALEFEGFSANCSVPWPDSSYAPTGVVSISAVDRLPLIENKPLPIGALESLARRALKPGLRRAPQFSPPGLRPPMFSRAPDNIVDPKFMETYAPRIRGAFLNAILLAAKTIYRAFRSVFIAAYLFLKHQLIKCRGGFGQLCGLFADWCSARGLGSL